MAFVVGIITTRLSQRPKLMDKTIVMSREKSGQWSFGHGIWFILYVFMGDADL